MASNEKRASRRVPVVLRIKLGYQDVDQFIEKFATNVSSGGMFIRSRKPKDVDTRIKFELRLADESPVIAGYGVVRWNRAYDPDKPRAAHGMGIQFTKLSKGSRAVINRIVARKRELGLPDEDDIPVPTRRRAPAAKVAPPAPMHEDDDVISSSPPPTAIPKAVEDLASAPIEIASQSRNGDGDAVETPRATEAAESTETTRREAVPVDELIARAEASVADSGPDVEELFGSVDLAGALARARRLVTAGDDADELDALLKVSPQAAAHSVGEASAELARLAGAPEIARVERAEPVEAAEPEPEPEPEPVAVAEAEPEPVAVAEPEPEPEPEAVAEPEPDTLVESLDQDDSYYEEPITVVGEEPAEAGDLSAEIAEAIEIEAELAEDVSTNVVRRPSAAQLAARSGEREPARVSESGSLDITDLVDQLDTEAGDEDLILELGEPEDDRDAHDLQAEALDADGIMASGVDRLAHRQAERRELPSTAPDLASFADPPPVPSDPLADIDAALTALEDEESQDDLMIATEAPEARSNDSLEIEVAEGQGDYGIVEGEEMAQPDAEPDDDGKKKGFFKRIFSKS